jgi:hypothetical protein
MELNVLKDANEPHACKNVCYEAKDRSFYIYDAGSNRYGTCINYCPFCGAKLPAHLIDERWSIILDEFGPEYLPDDRGNPPKKELPPEFQTDEWWRKRGL